MQVAYTLLVPCLLFTKVGATLTQQSASSLLGIPLLATVQVRQDVPTDVLAKLIQTSHDCWLSKLYG